MLHGVTHRYASAARTVAVALAVLALACASPALAAAANAKAITTAASLTASQTAQIAAMQADFGSKVADYVAITRELHRTEDEVAQVTSQIASGEAELETARSALATRAVELYRAPSIGLLESLFTATSFEDLVKRVSYLAIITEHDARLLKNLRLAQTEEAWLQESLQVRVVQLQQLQGTADKKQVQLLRQLAAEQARAAALNTVFTPGIDSSRIAATPSGSVPRNQFDRANVVSENNFRGGSAMTAAAIQLFLDRQPGALKRYSGKDHWGATRTAAQMISQESIRFNINPKIMLATLQKEQSLLTAEYPSQSQLDWALGAGKADTFTTTSMKGFGNQIYWGAQKFDKNARDWSPGKTERVDGTSQVSENEGTFAQYRYTPHYGGVTSFWTIFWRYFGDPLG
ncbi:MAG TPA: hypothetical protein VIL41_05010 [Coriobacteriia bacterium]